MLGWIRKKLSGPTERQADHHSVVILLRQPVRLTPAQSLEKGNKAWGANMPVDLVSTLNDESSVVLRSGKFIFAVHQASQRYESGRREASESSQRPWDEHTAWMSVDFPAASSSHLRQINSLGSCYKRLLTYAFLCWSPNSLAVYFPMEGPTVPNLGDLAESIKWARRNGINLDFLKDA